MNLMSKENFLNEICYILYTFLVEKYDRYFRKILTVKRQTRVNKGRTKSVFAHHPILQGLGCNLLQWLINIKKTTGCSVFG